MKIVQKLGITSLLLAIPLLAVLVLKAQEFIPAVDEQLGASSASMAFSQSSQASEGAKETTRAELLAIHAANFPDEPCEDTLAAAPDEVSLYETDEGTFVSILCNVYASQTDEIWFIHNDDGYDRYDQQTFVVMNEGAEEVYARIMTTEFDPETRRLTSVTKFRGLGDCGREAVYSWQDGRFVLEEQREKPNCDGELDEWPIIYSAD